MMQKKESNPEFISISSNETQFCEFKSNDSNHI